MSKHPMAVVINGESANYYRNKVINDETVKYYHDKGLDNLTREDLSEIDHLITIIKRNRNTSQYPIAQELYDIYGYLISDRFISYGSHDLGQTGEFLGNLSLINESCKHVEMTNDFFMYYQFTRHLDINGVPRRSRHKIMEMIIIKYEYFKQFTGRQYIIPMITERHTYVERELETKDLKKINYEQLTDIFGTGLSVEDAYGYKPSDIMVNTDPMGNNPYREYIDSIRDEIGNRRFYTLDHIIDIYNQGKLDDDLTLYHKIIKEGMSMNVRIRRAMRELARLNANRKQLRKDLEEELNDKQ